MLERENDWYCLKDDVIVRKTKKPADKPGTPGTPGCAVCGLGMVLLDSDNERWYCYQDDVTFYGKEERWVGVPAPSDINSYPAIYVDGFGNEETGHATIELFEDTVRVKFTDYQPEKELEFPYTHIEVLNINQEREITGLRTFLVGPVLAAAFKKGVLELMVGFRDENELLQLPKFQMEKDTIYNCYATVLAKMRAARLQSDR